MDFPNSGKNRRGKSKKMSGSDEDSNINADDIPEGSRKAFTQDMSNVQGTRNRVAGSSTTSGILGPPPLNSFKKNREERVRKRDGDNNADYIPEDARKIVQQLKEIITRHSEREIYAMLLECKMDPAEAIDQLHIIQMKQK